MLNRYKLLNNSGWYLISLVTLIPVLIMLFSSSVPLVSYYGIGKLLGLVGTVLFSISFILSTRLKILQVIFVGFNKIYQVHSKIGQLALILLMFHPVFLLSNYAISPKSAFSFFMYSDNLAINFGISSLYLMLILIILTLYFVPKYNLWKFTHKFLGLAFMFGALHAYLISSDISTNPILRIYMLTIISLGILAYTYKTFLGKYLIKKFDYKVVEVNKLNNLSTEIVMSPIYDQISYKVGQFVFVQFINSNISSESHPFSLTSSPDSKNISLVIKGLGDYTKSISKLELGTNVKVEGPYGNFNYQNSKYKDQIWIAGGIGITPFISMVKSLQIDKKYNINLFYSVKNQSDIVMFDKLKTIEKDLGGYFKLCLHVTAKSGYLTADIIKQIVNIENKDIYICAPPAMIKSFKQQFSTMGVSDKLIHSEEFSL